MFIKLPFHDLISFKFFQDVYETQIYIFHKKHHDQT
jgi:hypothetical protein